MSSHSHVCCHASLNVTSSLILWLPGMRESITNRIEIKDIDAPTFKAVLKFIYCGDFPEDVESAAVVYLPIAEIYGIQELKEKSARALERDLTAGNVIERLILAHLHQCSSLKERCFHFLQAQPPLDDQALKPLDDYPDLWKDYMRYRPS